MGTGYNYSVTWADNTTSGTAANDYYYTTPWVNTDDYYTYKPSGTITVKSADTEELKKKVEELEKKLKGEEGRMRSLFKVYVVDPRKQGKLLKEATIIAETEEQALLKAGVAQVAEEGGLELEKVDTLVDNLGEFIRPRKETQKVKMVQEEDD